MNVLVRSILNINTFHKFLELLKQIKFYIWLSLIAKKVSAYLLCFNLNIQMNYKYRENIVVKNIPVNRFKLFIRPHKF